MLRTYLLALLLGAAVGVLAGVYLRAVSLLIGLLWDGPHSRLPVDPALGIVATCVVGGLVVGVLRRRHERDSPHDVQDALRRLDEVLADEAEKPPPRVRWLLRAAALGIVSLAAGASLGPEAPLLVLATGFGQRMAKILHTTQREAAYISATSALSGLFGGPLGAVVLPVEHSAVPVRATRLLGPGVVAAVAGLLALLLVVPDEGALRYRLPQASTGLAETIGWAAAAGVLATLAVVLLQLLIAPARTLAQRMVRPTVVRAAAGGLVLGVCGVVEPLALFSGEREGQDLIDLATKLSVSAVLVIVAFKMAATLACLATGWFGGQIFPGAFTGMAAALLTVAVFPSAPVAVVVGAGAGAGATALLGRPLAAALIMLLFVPVHALLALLVGCGVAAVALAALGDRAPAPPALGHGP